MAAARLRHDWNHTANLLAMLYNLFRDPRRPARAPKDFHPFTETPTLTLKDLMPLIPRKTP